MLAGNKKKKEERMSREELKLKMLFSHFHTEGVINRENLKMFLKTYFLEVSMLISNFYI